jgi:hypothetical protein
MCDPLDPYTSGQLTGKDLANARKYAIMKAMFNNAKKYTGKLEWVNSNQDGSPNYRCPDGLKCYDGHVRIANKQECISRRNNFLKNYMENDKYESSAVNGWYLEWRTGQNPKGDCYLGNSNYRKNCETGVFDNQDKDKAKGKGTLYYDEDNARCMLTPAYCSAIGKKNYVPGPGPNGYGGSCELDNNQKALDFFFGATATKYLSTGTC